MTKFIYDFNVESHINYWKLTIKVCDSFWWLLTVHFPTYLKGILNGGYINFGNLLLIRHRNGFVTAYAHTSRILVERGETVLKGQVVARVGLSGNVNSPQVHFEVRQGSRAINPKTLLDS